MRAVVEWLKRGARAVARWVFGPYRLNRVYELDLGTFATAARDDLDIRTIDDIAQLQESDCPKIRKGGGYGGSGATGFGIWIDGTLASVCWLWDHVRFTDRLIWDVQENEAALVELVTSPNYRGRGLAPAIIRHAAEAMKQANKKRLITWMWRSNRPSIIAFEKAGWSYLAYAVELYPFGRKKPLHFWRHRRPGKGD